MRIPHNEPLGSDITGAHPDRETGPERRCILTGLHASRDELIRLAISPDGLVLPDPLAKAPGRGAWIGVSGEPLQAAITKGTLKGALARAFKGAALTIPADLVELTLAGLTRALLQRLGLELVTGKLLLGSDRIAEQARSGRVVWLGHAADAGEDGTRKLDQAWRVGEDAEGTQKAGTRLPLDRAALSVALGRDNVVHLALIDSAAARRVAVPLDRLLRFAGRIEATTQDTGEGAQASAAAALATIPDLRAQTDRD